MKNLNMRCIKPTISWIKPELDLRFHFQNTISPLNIFVKVLPRAMLMNEFVSHALITSEMHCGIVAVIHEIIHLIPEGKFWLAAGVLLRP